MLYGKVFSGAFGPTPPMILCIKGSFFGGGLLARIYVRPEYAERYFAVFVNGVYAGCFKCSESGFLECVIPGIATASAINSITIEDVGALADIPADTLPYIQAQIRRTEALTANRINIVWDNLNKYKLTGVNGDTQLSGIAITGAQRGLNCTADQFRPQRARLYYSILHVGDAIAAVLPSGNSFPGAIDFTNAGFTLSGATVSADALANPIDGVVNADLLIESVANSAHYIYESVSITAGTYVTSVYAKMSGRRYLSLGYTDGYAVFDLQAGTITANGGAKYSSSSIQDAGGGWYRCVVSRLETGAGTYTPCFVAQSSGAGIFTAYLGDGVSGIYLWGADHRAGSTPGMFATYLTFTRWYDGNRLVAEGSRIGDGAVTCDEVDGSGLSITATMAYTGDVIRGAAFIDLKWPALYKIFHSTSAIVYSGPAQGEVEDSGGVDFNYISNVLAAGSYNYNVVAVDDEGDAETGMTDLGPVVLNALPTVPIISSITYVSANVLRVAFTGDAGATHKIYFSEVNQPINFGDMVSPAPVAATTPTEDITIPAFTPQDNTTAYATLATAFDAAVAAAHRLFVYASFADALDTLSAALIAATDTYAAAIRLPLRARKEALSAICEQCALNIATLTDSDLFDASAATYYGLFLNQLGSILEDNPARYSLPDGTATGTADDPKTGESLYDIALPMAKRNLVHVVIRSTLAGVEEQTDKVWEVELTAAGAIVTARPQKAFIIGYELDQSGGNRRITVRAGIIEDDGEAASSLDLYVNTGTPVITVPTQNKALGVAVAGYKEITFTAEIVTANTWYNVAVAAKTAAGTRSETYSEPLKVYSGSDTPVAPGNIAAYVVRSKGS